MAMLGSSARITRAACRPSVPCAGVRMSMIASSGRAERQGEQALGKQLGLDGRQGDVDNAEI
jgi:hypothetical protein